MISRLLRKVSAIYFSHLEPIGVRLRHHSAIAVHTWLSDCGRITLSLQVSVYSE